MVYVEKVKALLRLFKGYEVDETFEVNDDEAKNKLLELGLMNGILFEDLTYAISPTIVGMYSIIFFYFIFHEQLWVVLLWDIF